MGSFTNKDNQND